MTPSAPPLPLFATVAGFRRFTVNEYRELTRLGILTEDDNIELLEGYLVHKMSRNPPHDTAIRLLTLTLLPLLPPGWTFGSQTAITLSDSEPEPDFHLARGDKRSYASRHPRPADIGLVVEVSDSSLQIDRSDKARIYARAGLPVYWIVNVANGEIELYEQPSGPTVTPAYGSRRVLKPSDTVPLILDGVTVAQIPVADLLP